MVSSYVVVEALFAITLVITASAFSSSFVNIFKEFGEAQRARLNELKHTLNKRVEIIFVYVPENMSILYVWVKNTGFEKISFAELERMDVFLVGRDVFQHLKHGSGPQTWSYELVRDVAVDGGWSWGETVKLTLRPESRLTQGEYTIRLATVDVKADYKFSVGG
jgi:archaellum component FlaF (FlaF/FlaG flagellin family)